MTRCAAKMSVFNIRLSDIEQEDRDVRGKLGYAGQEFLSLLK
jgi:hypothetical protein